MSNNNVAALLLQLSYVGPGGNAQDLPQIPIGAQYRAQNVGVIDVPDATASATTYSVPFGEIKTDATLGIILNQTGQPLELKVNAAAAASQTIPDGGVFLWANPTGAGSIPVLAASLKTTAIQSGDGSIAYWLFGDPAA